MGTYTRPVIEPLEFRDGSGAVVDYGSRWAGLDTPPEDMYSVVDHPERFAPLQTVAAAESVTRAVRLRPRSAHAAPLTFVWTSDPAVRVHAGVLFERISPSCPCNACDERWNECADATASPGRADRHGQTRAEDVPAEVLESARATLHAVHAASSTHEWRPWPEKQQRS